MWAAHIGMRSTPFCNGEKNGSKTLRVDQVLRLDHTVRFFLCICDAKKNWLCGFQWYWLIIWCDSACVPLQGCVDVNDTVYMVWFCPACHYRVVCNVTHEWAPYLSICDSNVSTLQIVSRPIDHNVWTMLLNRKQHSISWYRSGTVNSNTVNSKFHFIQSFYEASVNIFSIISCLKCTVNSNFHLIRSKTLPMNDFELTVPDLYIKSQSHIAPCERAFNFALFTFTVKISLFVCHCCPRSEASEGYVFTGVCHSLCSTTGGGASWDRSHGHRGEWTYHHPPRKERSLTYHLPPSEHYAQAGGTHPTGMLSFCVSFNFFFYRYMLTQPRITLLLIFKVNFTDLCRAAFFPLSKGYHSNRFSSVHTWRNFKPEIRIEFIYQLIIYLDQKFILQYKIISVRIERSQKVTVLANVYTTNQTTWPGTWTNDERSQMYTILANVYTTNRTAWPGTSTNDERSKIVTVLANVYMTNQAARPGTSTNDERSQIVTVLANVYTTKPDTPARDLNQWYPPQAHTAYSYHTSYHTV